MATISIDVPSAAYWRDTGVDVAAGQLINFSAAGTWRDWFIDCCSDGYDRPYLTLLSPLRRVPSAPWFCLCVAVNKDIATVKAIGASAAYAFNQAGRIFAFANDVPFGYFNNYGAVTLRIDF